MTPNPTRIPRSAGPPTTRAVLEAGFAGELIGPDHPDYDQARKLYNGMHDKRPAARCTL